MLNTMFFILAGYLSGSILFAEIVMRLFGKEGIVKDSADKNPGTANAFKYGGFLCGIITLAGDMLKGFLPVYLYVGTHGAGVRTLALALVLAAPVIGHILPVFYRFQGGKGIAVSFGCLLGLHDIRPAVVLAAYFIFFSLILKITPHFYRTVITYLCSSITMGVFGGINGVTLGFLLITCVICLRLHFSKEKRERMKVLLSWMR